MGEVGPTRRRVAGLVLAAGSASRFGATKQLAEVDGRPLVAHVVDAALTAELSPVVVVVGHDADDVAAAVPPDAEVVVNDQYVHGQSVSLRVGLGALGPTDAGGVVVLLADEPRVQAHVVRRVAEALRDGNELVRCVYDDRPGHPVGIARSRWADAAEADGRDIGARDLLRGPDTFLLPVEGPAPVDVDRPEDLPDG